jgi:long-chain acyl-CoA synthetase
MVSRVLSDPTIDSRDVRSLRAVSLGGSPVAPELMDRMRACFPNVERGISVPYGLSEAGGILTVASGRDTTKRPGTVGRPLPLVQLRIDEPDEAGNGEVVARTPTQMLGYWGDDQDGTIDDEGWLHTGDLGRLDTDGYLYITGRLKDLIIRGGENIAAAHVESILLQHPEVCDVCVVGRTDPDLGEAVGAAVVVSTASTVTVEELSSFARDRLAYFEVPTEWWLRTSSLPSNDVGKVQKRAVLAEWPESRGVLDERIQGERA